MRLALRAMVFLLTSFVQVQVHAGIVLLPNQEEPYQEPNSCLVREPTCAMKTAKGHKFETQIGSSKVILGSDTILLRLGQDAVLLVQGEVWVKAVGRFSVKSEYGDLSTDSGELWVVRSEKDVLMRTLHGQSVIVGRGLEEKLPLSEGFEITLSGVTSRGHAGVSLPAVINFRDHLHRWAQLYPGPRKEFIHEIHRFDPILREAARASAEFDRTMITRQLASEDEEFAREKADHERFDRESARLRELFLERANR